MTKNTTFETAPIGTEPFKVGIIGSYGGLNLGDEAILQSILIQLRRSVPAEVTVFSRNPEDTLRRHQVERALPVRTMSRNEILPELQRLDVLVLGGGGILFDGEAKTFLREVELAHEVGVPVMVYAIGAGPLEDPVSQKAVRDALNRCEVITVRENRARQVLERADVDQDVIVTADPALLLEPEPLTLPLPEFERHEGRCFVGFSIREPGPAAPGLDIQRYHQLLADAADYIVDRYNADIVFLPMERQTHDMQHSHAVISNMLFPERAMVMKTELGSAQMLGIMQNLDFAVGMRLHFLIFAALQNVPFVALPYASKVDGFLESLEIKVPPIHLVNAGRMLAYIDQAWDQRDELKRKMKERLPELQARARQTNEILIQLLQDHRQEKSRGSIEASDSQTDSQTIEDQKQTGRGDQPFASPPAPPAKPLH